MQTIDFRRLNLSAHHLLLDLGCGEGRHAHAAAWHSLAPRVFAVDINERDVHTARTRFQEWPQEPHDKECFFCVADGFALPFSTHSFDVIICSEVLEHVDDYPSMLNEMHRLLKPGGRLAVSVPRAWPETLCWRLSSAYHEVEGGHIRIFNASKLRHTITSHGFAFVDRHWAHALHTPYWWLRCLFWRDGEQVACVRWYHRLLVWDLMRKPWLTRALEKCLNPLLGKSIVMYFVKETETP